MTSTRIGIETNLDPDQIEMIRDRIVSRWYDRAGYSGAKYGIDMPTAKVLWPREYRVFIRLRDQWNSLR